MRFRMGMAVGFGAGYYLGARAGRERYLQINDLVRKAKRSDTFEVVADRAREVVDTGVDRARDLADTRRGNGASEIDLNDTNPPMRP